MKNKNHKSETSIIYAHILLIIVMGTLLFASNMEIEEKIILIFLIIITHIYHFIKRILKHTNKENVIKLGELKKGYIIDITKNENDGLIYKTGNLGEITFIVDGKKYTKSNIKQDEMFMNIYNNFHKRYHLENGNLKFKGKEFDVYIYINKAEPYLENIKQDKEDEYEITI